MRSQSCRTQIAQQGWGLWAVETRHDQNFIGLIGLQRPNPKLDLPVESIEICWRLMPEHWGHGYGAEGARAALDYGFLQLHLTEIVALTAVANQRSIALMERLGMNTVRHCFNHPALPAWVARMTANGTLAGGCYALKGAFVERIREQNIYIPRGLIGEDWLVSILSQTDLQPLTPKYLSRAKIIFAKGAGFSFKSLSPMRPTDYGTYLNRVWRDALRGVQFEMLANWMIRHRPTDLPTDVETLYCSTLPPSRLRWIGKTSIFRALAVQSIRTKRAKNAQTKA